MKRELYVSIFLLLFTSFNLFAQNEPPHEVVMVCIYSGSAYYDASGPFTDVGTGTWPFGGATRKYVYNPSGARAVNYGSNNAYACYRFVPSVLHESCSINGQDAIRGYFLKTSTCPFDDETPILLAISSCFAVSFIMASYKFNTG